MSYVARDIYSNELFFGESKKELLDQVCHYRLEGSNRCLMAKFNGTNQYIFFGGFDEDDSNERVNELVVNILFTEMKGYGFTIFKEIV